MTKTVRVAREFSDSSKVTFYAVEEARCRACGYTFRVSSPDDQKFGKAELCKVCYYEDGNGHEREGLCAYPGCDEAVTRRQYCEYHGEQIGGYASIGLRAVARAVAAMNRPPIADEWDAADFDTRRGLLMRAGVRVYQVKRCKSLQVPWERVAAQTQRRLAMRLDNVVI